MYVEYYVTVPYLFILLVLTYPQIIRAMCAARHLFVLKKKQRGRHAAVARHLADNLKAPLEFHN